MELAACPHVVPGRARRHTHPRQRLPLTIHPFLCRAVEQHSYLECVGACRPLDHHRVHHFLRVLNILHIALFVPPSEPGLPRRVAPIPRGWGWWARRGGRGGRRERAAGPAVRAVPREAGVPGEVPPRGPRSAGGFSGDIDRLWVRRRGRTLFMSVGCKTVCDVLLYAQGRGVLLFRKERLFPWFDPFNELHDTPYGAPLTRPQQPISSTQTPFFAYRILCWCSCGCVGVDEH